MKKIFIASFMTIMPVIACIDQDPMTQSLFDAARRSQEEADRQRQERIEEERHNQLMLEQERIRSEMEDINRKMNLRGY